MPTSSEEPPQTAVGGQPPYEGPLGALRLIFRVYYGQSFWSPSKQSLKNDHKAMIFCIQKEPVHDYVRQTLF